MKSCRMPIAVGRIQRLREDMKMLRRVCVMVLGTLFLCTFGAMAEAPALKKVVVPFELLASKHIAVMVKINGQGPYRMIFDTGAPFSLVNSKVAKSSGMIAKNAVQPWFTIFGNLGPMKIKTFEIGDLKIENTTAAVMDHPTVEMISQVLGPIEGLVGFPFFARYAMTIDYQAKQMTLVPNGYKPDDSADAIMSMALSMMENRKATKVLTPAAQWGFVPAKAKDDAAAGVIVETILPGGAADSAGLRTGDRLLTLDGRWTDSLVDTYHAAGFIKPGSPAAVVVKRNGKTVKLTIIPRTGL